MTTITLEQPRVTLRVSVAELQIDDVVHATNERVAFIQRGEAKDYTLVTLEAPDQTFDFTGIGNRLMFRVRRIIGPLAVDLAMRADGLRTGDVLINGGALVLATADIAERPDSISVRYETPEGNFSTDLERSSLHPIRRGTGRRPRI